MGTKIITDNKGNKTGVILSMKDYNRLKEMAEELSDIKAYDKVKSTLHKQKLIPLHEVIRQRKQTHGNGK